MPWHMKFLSCPALNTSLLQQSKVQAYEYEASGSRPCLDHVDGGEIAVEAVQGPGSEGELQETDNSVDRVVNRHHAPKVGGPEQSAKDGEVARVQEESPRAPHYQCHHLRRNRQSGNVFIWAGTVLFLACIGV